MEKKEEPKLTGLQKVVRACQYGVISSLERFFTWYGCLVATYPKTAIVCCILATLGGGLGLLRFYEEGDAAALVIPTYSEFRRNIDWLDNNFPREVRVHSIVYTAENVLTPKVIRTIYRQRRALDELAIGEKTFEDLCIQVPILKFPDEGFSACNRKEEKATTVDSWADFDDFAEFDEEFESFGENETGDGLFAPLLGLLMPQTDVNIDVLENWSDEFYPDLYCGCVEATETACFEQNIVELWGDQGSYNEVSDIKIAGLTEKEILETINNKNVSQIFLKDFNFKDLLGDVKRNSKGEIISAGAVEMKFFTTVNITAVKLYGTATRGEKIDMESFNFEGLMIDLLKDRSWFPAGVTSYVNCQRQFFDSFVGQTFKDADKLGGGYILVFIYVNVMLSKMNFVEQRIWLSVIGIMSVVMGMILGYGLCSLFGLFYSAAHTVIPFILLGIGIDNIFVITQTFNTLETTSTPAPLAERFGQTMKHAGVAVSVTTFTDVIAFFVGSNTVLPGLQSFCIYAAVAIFAIYALQVTHFVAWFSLDVRRQNAHRDGCLCCYTHKNFKSYEFSKGSLLNKAFAYIGVLITKKLVQALILILTAGFLVGGIWGALSLTQEYQPEWLLPPESEIAKWFSIKEQYFPSNGEPGFIMIKQIDIAREFGEIEHLVDQLAAPDQKWNIEKISPWHPAFRDYVNKFKKTNDSFETLIRNETYFRDKFTQFLYSPRGGIFQPNFWFSEPLKCGEPAPDVLLQAISYSHKRFERSGQWIPAMRKVQQVVKDTPFSNDSFPIALTYINWETDAIVGIELIRNMGIAMICIFITTLMTLGSWRGSVFVMMCVLFTSIDVAGFMHWWGLTIDITSMNVLIISVGLCVDFCAHIVHGFLTGHGNKEERVMYIMENIAPAVLNGGFSSLLALSLLVTSKSHIFVSFFKIFFMICVFGLFHGLVLLPAVLCLVGPTDEETKVKQKIETKPQENGHVPKTTHSNDSEKYLRENEQNLQTEYQELGEPLASELTESLLENNLRETAIV
eukprot:GFUD01025500.1.p1 GENE.GFUD01025500.1~~GFUD01025500.1.p1  ORF type:complete len:1021 (+),score=134.31 GFUD01025500.1:157-3219(+)